MASSLSHSPSSYVNVEICLFSNSMTWHIDLAKPFLSFLSYVIYVPIPIKTQMSPSLLCLPGFYFHQSQFLRKTSDLIHFANATFTNGVL